MTIEVGALEQAYAKIESTYAASAGSGGEALSATDGIRHLELSLTAKNNREPSPEKRGTPDVQQSLPRRRSQTFNLSSIMWEPSGTLGTQSNVGKFLEAGFGSKNAISGGLATTVNAAPAPTASAFNLNSLTGLAVQDILVVTTTAGREATRVLTISVWTTTPPVACTAALVAGAGNVDTGTHSYKVVFVHPTNGDSQGGAVSNTVTTDTTTDGQVDLTGISVGPSGTTARKVYRSEAGDAVTGPWKLLTTIGDNTTTIFTDNVADVGLGATLDDSFGITVDPLSTAPAAGAAAVAGVTYKLTNNITHSLSVYKYLNAGGFKQAVFGAVVDQIQAAFDGTKEVLLQIQGPAGRYADSTTTVNPPTEDAPQAKPAAHTTVGAPASGMVGNFYVDGNAFLVISAQVTVNNQIELRNKELGTRYASGIAGRGNLRQVPVRVTFYLEDTRLFALATASGITSATGVLRFVVGDTNGSMVACVCPKVEFEIPDVGNEIGPKELTIEGMAYAVSGNDQVTFAEL